MQDTQMKLNPGLSYQKQHSTRRRLRHQIGRKFKEGSSEVLHAKHSYMVLKLGHL
jgi:hypothetical protein